MYTLFLYFPVADVVYAFHSSHLPGKVIVLLLFVGSVFAWTIMLTKMMELRRARIGGLRFLASYRGEASPLGIYLKRQPYGQSPPFAVYGAGCRAMGRLLEAKDETGDLLDSPGGYPIRNLSEREAKAVRNMVERTMADQALALESYMGFLATAVTVAPFLGLLGTVWGVMDSFGSMAAHGAATLAAVAPGVSGALLTTVVGLLVALPSSVGYNALANRIRRLCVEMENFAGEFLSDIDRYFSMGA
ncbi:MAG: MotA/TolQ/ExbB proton channel family protein [Kiritimatiellae bacterium]|nr:MotA/TolQ/ExbB proton channel family protein [Kiritimatiellia bacterium]